MLSDELSDERDFALSDRAAPVLKRHFHAPHCNRIAPGTQAPPPPRPDHPSLLLHSRTHTTPRRSGLSRLGVAAHQKHLQFVGFQNFRDLCLTRRPEAKSPARQSFVRQPKPLAIVGEHFDRRPPTVAENHKTARKGIRS